MAIYRGAGGAGDATGDSASEALLVRELAAEVALDAAEAEASRAAAVVAQLAAETAETNAETAETNAETAQAAAAASASSASSSATSATASKNAAATSATSAASSATSATSSKNAAATSATNAASSATAAATSATNANNSANAAATSATNAANSATSAASSATTATTQATNASNSATAAATSATNAANSATSASTSASTATTQVGIATTQATNAANSASAAATSATNASNSASAAATSATNASNSASAASTSASNAATSASNAATSETNAGNFADDASDFADAAALSATNASTSATEAAASAAAATAAVFSPEAVRHSVRPSLLLDFANTKTLDPRITFTRASTGTFYDGKTVAKAEENLFTYSQEFENAYWVKGDVTVTANSTTAPDGTTTADTLVEGSGSLTKVLAPLVSASGIVTLSVFAKPATGSRFLTIQVNRSGTNYASATFDLSAGTSTQTQVTGTYSGVTASITVSTNGFYRCAMAVTTDTVSEVRIGLNNTGTPTSANRGTGAAYTGDGTSSLYIWGAQIEQRSSVTAYTATTTAPITNYIPALQTAASGVARFEHNPVTGESLGLEIEEQRTNLLTYSEDYSNASWSKSNSTVSANTIIAPDGTLTGEKLIANTSLAIHFASQTISVSSGTTYTLCCFIKAGEETTAMLSLSTPPFPRVKFDLSNGTIISSAGGGTGTITAVGNGWYRCTVSFSAPATSISPTISIRDTDANWTGNGFGGIYIWGAQLEAGSFATSYIPTVASQVTRSADAASMTGTNFSSWYRADEGTLYADYLGGTGNTGRRFATINDGTISNTIRGVASNGAGTISNYGEILVGGNIQAALGASGAYSATAQKFSIAYLVNDIAASKNGATALTDSSATIPVVNRIEIGAEVGGNILNGTIKKLAYYPKRLTNAELQGLTAV